MGDTIPDEIELTKESYERCLKSPEFFSDFYQNFTSKGPQIVEKFKNTDMDRQMEALRHGLQYVIMFAAGSKIAVRKVDDLGLTHDRDHRNITPEMYEAWVTSLIETVKKHDPEYSDDVAINWRNVLSHGISRMKAMY